MPIMVCTGNKKDFKLCTCSIFVYNSYCSFMTSYMYVAVRSLNLKTISNFEKKNIYIHRICINVNKEDIPA